MASIKWYEEPKLKCEISLNPSSMGQLTLTVIDEYGNEFEIGTPEYSFDVNAVNGGEIYCPFDEVRRVGRTSISYTNGKVSRIGDVEVYCPFDEVRRVGRTSISYTNGKISRVGSVEVYHPFNQVTRVGGASISYSGSRVSNISGKVK